EIIYVTRWIRPWLGNKPFIRDTHSSNSSTQTVEELFMPKLRSPLGLTATACVMFLVLAGFPLMPAGWSEPRSASANSASGPTASLAAASPAQPGRAVISKAYGKVPLAFEPNLGQAPPSVKFLSRSAASSIFLTSSGATAVLSKGHDKTAAG